MSTQPTDEFYVGYQPAAPVGFARFVRHRVPGLGGLALGIILIVAWNRKPPAPAHYEFGTIRRVTGRVLERPYPMLASQDSSGPRIWLLAALYKRGADSLVAGLDGHTVAAQVTRIERPGAAMFELHGIARTDDADALPVIEQDLGTVTLTGEVVDGKCWIGAMNPGDGPTHRLCAARCLRGGLPPMLAGHDSTGAAVNAVLAGGNGGRIDSLLLAFVAARVRVTGRLRRIGTLLVLDADPATMQRVTP